MATAALVSKTALTALEVAADFITDFTNKRSSGAINTRVIISVDKSAFSSEIAGSVVTKVETFP